MSMETGVSKFLFAYVSYSVRILVVQRYATPRVHLFAAAAAVKATLLTHAVHRDDSA